MSAGSKATSQMESIDQLTERINILERRLVGSDPVPVAGSGQSSLSERILNIHKQFEAHTAGRSDKFKAVLKRIHQIEKYVEPSYISSLEDTTEMKAAVILSQADDIHRMCADLSAISEISEVVLNSEHLRGSLSVVDKLSDLERVQLGQWEECGRVSGEVRDLVERYNSLIQALSQQLVAWDQAVSACLLAETDQQGQRDE